MPRLHGVDISGWDEGIDVRALTADFVIVKSTEGVQGTVYNPGYRAMADAVLDSGKLLGFYHYANGGDPIAEADCFVDSIIDYRGRAIASLDWEGQGNPLFLSGQDVDWCRRFLDRLRERFGGTPLIYTSKSACLAYDWGVVARDYPLWGAEYAYDDYTYDGYQSDPWQSAKSWGAWGHGELMHQYGYVNPKPNNGGKASLDAEVFNGSREDWARLCGGGGTVGKLLSYQDMIAEAAEHYAYHDAHGYSQPNRAGDGTIEELTYSDGTPMRIRGGDKDCSEDVRACVAAAGLIPWDYWESYMWTENEYDVLTSHGFVRLPFDWETTQRGDILWVKGHTGVALGNGLQADAHGDEYGGIDGPNEGDQTGHEIEVRDLQWYWTYTYRYVGPARPQPASKPKPEQRLGDPKNSNGIKYRTHVQNVGWCDVARDGQTAGTEGFSARLEAVKVSPPEGVVLDAMVHEQGVGDVWFRGIKAGPRSGIGSSDIDPIIGTVGESRRVEGIEIDVVEWPRSLRGKWLWYQVHLQGIGWCDPVRAGTFAGTRGESRRLEAVRIWIE